MPSTEELQGRIDALQAELATARQELLSFSYSVSHDLRSPLRTIAGFSQALEEDCAQSLGYDGLAHLHRIRDAVSFMERMLEGMLELSRVARMDLSPETVDVTALASSIGTSFRRSHPGRRIDFEIERGLTAQADPDLLEICLEQILGNAVKFTSRREAARIEMGRDVDGRNRLFVRDNGAGFDEKYAAKMFEAFQRLHSSHEFEGLGLGLAIVDRIVRRHGGRAWATGRPEAGATVFIELP
jgi:signal transduction histidine kinase